MSDPLDQVLRPIGQLMRFLKLLSFVFLILLFLLMLRWVEIDLRINGEKIKADLTTTGRNLILLLKPQNQNTEPVIYSRSNHR